ncbi:MAG: methyltransferase domain-containing protein [Deltaproteobacteria bacterium]|nr:methyltransferase domain-containing protein [Deltaproteobacteria bacterium]
MKPDAPGLHSRADLFELEILDGLKPLCLAELEPLLGQDGEIFKSSDEDRIAFSYAGSSNSLLSLKTAVAVFQLLYFKVPRPHIIAQGGQLLRLLEAIENLPSRESFSTFRISAAGSDSPSFQKIKKIISQRSGLRFDEADGQLVIRFRRAALKSFGWDVLLRLTPLPLSARAWRKKNMPGALNATIAAAMLRLLNIQEADVVLNLMCGSGTFAAETQTISPCKLFVGTDIALPHLRFAKENIGTSRISMSLVQSDARALPFSDACCSVLIADLPWGRLIGNPESLAELYATALREAARVCRSNGRFAVITQENKLFDEILKSVPGVWREQRSLRVNQGEYRPKIYLLKRV